MAVADVSPPESVEKKVAAQTPEEAGASVEPPVETSNPPTHKMFQRTLSPADVLHVHSYAKGDYGEEVLPKEEEKSSNSDTEKEKELRQVIKEVSEP